MLINYSLLDAARMDDRIYDARAMNEFHSSLYKGRNEEILPTVAPYIFVYIEHSTFARWFHEEGWGNSWGIFVASHASFEELHHHFRKFLKVKTEEGENLYFRFYDPRVLRIFLPTCDSQQLSEFFGPVQYFLMEDEDPKFVLKFELKQGQLSTTKIPAAEVFTNNIVVSEKKKTGWSHLG